MHDPMTTLVSIDKVLVLLPMRIEGAFDAHLCPPGDLGSILS